MRKFMTIAALAIATAFAGTAPAAASWECMGPAFACDDAPAVTVHSKKSGKASSAIYKSKKRASSYSASYEGGGTSGKASYYWQPQRVASGGWFNPNAMTAAHKTLPFGTKVRVTNRVNGKSVVVTINDRGPYVKGRIIDLSKAAAQAISMTGMGVAPISMTVLGRG